MATKNLKITLLVMALMIVLTAGSFQLARAEENCPEGGCDSTTVETDVDQQQSLWWNYNPVSEDNVSIGGWLHASGMTQGLPDIPLHWKLAIQQYNEAGPGEIFKSMPELITRDNIAAYYRRLKHDMSDWNRGKLKRNLNKRFFVWIDGLEPKNSLRVFSRYPNARDPKTGKSIAIKGQDYKMIARIVFNSEKELVYRDDQAIRIIEDALDMGADALIVTGFGARRVFATKAGALSLLTAFGQVFTTGWTGAINVSPGGGVASGSNQTETLPFLRVAAIQVLSKEKFVLGMLHQEKFDKAVKQETTSEIVDEDLIALREEIAQRKTEIAACAEDFPNKNLRYSQGVAYLNLATKTPDDKERQGALVGASDNFGQSLRDGMKGDQAKEINGYLASIWYAMAQDQPEEKRGPFFDKVREFAARAGIEEVDILKFNK